MHVTYIAELEQGKLEARNEANGIMSSSVHEQAAQHPTVLETGQSALES